MEGGKIDINAVDMNKTTALHIAAKSGNPEIVEFLLEHGADIKLKDYRGRNALDAAIDKDQRMSIISILKSSSWKEALRTATARTSKWNTKLDTPMRRLIEKFPEEAELVLDRCYKETKSGDDISVEMNWEFIEDTFNYKRLDKSDMVNAKWRWNKLFDFDNKDGEYEHITEQKTYDADNAEGEDTFSEPYTKDFQLRMRNHPLMKMVGHNRAELLNHPLCLALIR